MKIENELREVVLLLLPLVQDGTICKDAIKPILEDYAREVILKRPRFFVINQQQYNYLRYKWRNQ